MYTLICRIFHNLHSWPRTVFLGAVLVTVASFFYARKLEFHSDLTQVLPTDFKSVQVLKELENKFGGLGKLSLIVSSANPQSNKKAINYIAAALKSHPDINFLDYKREAEFFKEHKLLYINIQDLQEIEKRIETGLWAKKKKYNPLLVNLLNDDEIVETERENLTFNDLERKYFKDMQEYRGLRGDSALILHIFPSFDISRIEKCRSLLKDVKSLTKQVPGTNQLTFNFTGEVLTNIQNEGRFLEKIIDSGWLSIISVFLLLLIFFFRVPLGPILLLIPLAMGIIWTMAFAYFFIGYLSIITLSLGIILLGLGLDAGLHLLSRYSEEKRKNLSASVAFEAIVLETGPAITTGALTSAAAFFAVTVTEFKGFSEFGLIAGIGMLCTLVSILLVFPCLLIILSPYGLIHVFGKRIYAHNQFTPSPYRWWKHHIILLLAVSGALLYQGIQTRFEYNFQRLGFPNQNAAADSLIQRADEAIASPAVVLASSQNQATYIAEYIRDYIKHDTLTPTIHSVKALTDLLPREQEQKLKIISNLKKLITPGIMQGAKGSYKENLEKLRQSWDVKRLTTANLPDNFRKMFTGRDSATGHFVFIFPALDINNGLNCILFAEDTRIIKLHDSISYYTSGMPIIYADLLGLMVPDTIKAVGVALITVLVLVFLNTKTFKGTLVIFVPLLLGLLWTLGAMKILGLRLNYFNLVVLPSMIGIGIDNSVHLYTRYQEEGLGSLKFVMRRTGLLIALTSFTSIAGFFGLIFSGHRGLFSMGITAVIGISLTLIASYLFVPVILGYIDTCRSSKKELTNS